MVRSFRRGALAAVLALTLAPLAAACAAGNSAQTLKVQNDAASATVGDIKVQNAFVLTQPDGPATITARLFNGGSANQTLQAVQVAGALNAQLSGPHGGQGVVVPAHGSVLLGGRGNPSATIASGGVETLRDGDVQDAVFLFSGTGRVNLQLNVTPSAGYFAKYGPSSLPTTPPPTTTAPAATTPAAPGSSTTPGAPGSTTTPKTTPTGTGTPPATGTTSSKNTGAPSSTTTPNDSFQ